MCACVLAVKFSSKGDRRKREFKTPLGRVPNSTRRNLFSGWPEFSARIKGEKSDQSRRKVKGHERKSGVRVPCVRVCARSFVCLNGK